ncbi:MAG: HIT family protein [Pseudomonadota bacterium]
MNATVEKSGWPVNATMEKFGWPTSRIAALDHWVVALRPAQPVACSLVVIAREPVTAFGDLSPAAFGELAEVTRRVEALARRETAYDRINWLMLMMVDPDVHFHVLPRYNGSRDLAGHTLEDVGWPGPPRLDSGVTLTSDEIASAAARLAGIWDRG